MHLLKDRFFPSLLFLPACVLMIATTAVAGESAWTVRSISGAVAIAGGDRSGSITFDARTRTRLVAPFSVRTGSNGQLVIVRGDDILTIGYDTRLDVQAQDPDDLDAVTRMHQATGSIQYQIGHRPERAFEVRTPDLVSTAEGRIFNIDVSADQTAVVVIEGLLHLYTPNSRQGAILEPGQIAVTTPNGHGLRIEDLVSPPEPVVGQMTIGRADNPLIPPVNEPASGFDRSADSTR